ncbi:MAG: hypothetical protein ACE5D1_07500 [Fidelibacterota bacterium]
MDSETNFKPLTEEKRIRQKAPSPRGKVLKKEQIQILDPLKIKPHTVQTNQLSSEMIEPIIEDGIVVGLYFTCVCGRTSEIRFELDHSQ